jgi:pimeloyl-ACP methyl ester carboxylesterase
MSQSKLTAPIGRWLIALLALAAIALGAWRLEAARDGLTIERVDLDGVPATVFAAPGAGRRPAVVIAHGFAGSQQLMQPIATTLAHAGFLAITFDFPGHGRNARPIPGRLGDDAAMSLPLLQALDAAIRYAHASPRGDGRVALLGHSMAADIVARRAAADPGIVATVGISMFSRAITPTTPRNLLVVAGAWEPARLIDEGRRIVAMTSGGPPLEDTTYGSFAEGTARRLVLADGVEHIAVIYSRETLVAARAWLREAFALPPPATGMVDARGASLGLMFLAIVALGWSLSALLPRVPTIAAGAALSGRRFAFAALAPALLTPLLLWPVPTDFLPILLGDYVAVHFAVYGVLTLLALRAPGGAVPHAQALGGTTGLAAAAAASLYGLAALGLPLDRYVTSFAPAAGRWWLVLAMLCGTLPFFLADAWLTRGVRAPPLANVATKALFLASLAIAIALAPRRLFFLVIIVPAILVLFVVHGLFSRWAWRATGNPFVGAVATAIAFAWAIAVTFPVISR